MPTITLTLQPGTAGIDRYIGSTGSGGSGNDENVYIGELNVNSNVCRTLIKFDLSTLPSNAKISSATLSLYTTFDYSTNARTARVYRLKRAWSEANASWTNYDTALAWQTAGGFGANDCEQTDIGSRAFTATESIGAFKNFSLTPTSKAALDLGNGWLIKMDTESDDGYEFASGDNTASANYPKLVIVYTIPPFRSAELNGLGSGGAMFGNPLG